MFVVAITFNGTYIHAADSESMNGRTLCGSRYYERSTYEIDLDNELLCSRCKKIICKKIENEQHQN